MSKPLLPKQQQNFPLTENIALIAGTTPSLLKVNRRLLAKRKPTLAYIPTRMPT